MKLKILQVSDFYYPWKGGIVEHIHHLYLEFKKLGHDVKILTTHFNEDDKKYDNHDIIRVGRFFSLPKFATNRAAGGVAFGYNLAKEVYDVLQEHKFDIVHIHGLLFNLPYLAIKYSTSCNVVTTHIAFVRNFWYNALKKWACGYFAKLHGRIAVSEVARSDIQKYFPGEYKIIPNGIDLNKFNPDVEPIQDLMDKPNILFVGRFDPRKGLPILLRAFPLIKKEVKDARLVIVGHGKPPRLPKDTLLFTNVAPNELPRFYRSATVFVSPATGHESFGIILLEAMATGVPIVASDIAGYKCVMQNGKQGLFFKTGDIKDLKDKVVEILKNNELRERLAQNGVKTAKNYSWEIVAKDIEKYYFELLGKHSL